MGTNLSTVAFTAQVAPHMKRAVASLSDGTAVAIVPDPNIATQTGADDISGTAKLRIYKSDAARTTWALNLTSTLSPVCCSATVPAIMSMVLDGSNNMHLVYVGTDNSLNYRFLTFSAGNYTLTTSQTVVASNAVTQRYRAVDIDVTGAGASASPAIIVYESKASAGPSAWIRVWARRSDNTTWDNIYIEDQATLPGGSNNIYPSSEDVSISWNAAGLTANVGQILIYACRIGIDWDRGDLVTELQYNISSGAASTLGSWAAFNHDVGTPYRRGWIFKTSNDRWQVALSAGLTAPKFQVMRLTHGLYGPPTVNTNAVAVRIWSDDIVGTLFPQLNADANPYNYMTVTYSDNRVFFGFITRNTPIYITSTGQYYSAVGVIFRYDDISSVSTSYQDSTTRPLDNYFQYGIQPVGLYAGGNNRNQSGDFKFNFLCLYGFAGNVSNGSALNKMRFVLDTFYDAPINTAPTSVAANDTPTLQVRVQNTALYPNVKGKIEWTLATDFNFTTNVKNILEPDVNYRYFGSINSSPPPAIPVSYKLTGVGPQKLFSGKWYMRARVVSDLGVSSPWSSTTDFTVAHQPTALPLYPRPGSLIEYGSGNVTFSWKFSDTEPADAQTKYQLVIQNATTGATVFDSGQVSSATQSVAVAIVSGNKDAALQWTVSLWDSDGVQGPFCSVQQFTVADSPSVLVTTPTNGATVSSAAPSVTWSATFGGGRTQKTFRVLLSPIDIFDTFVRAPVSNGWGVTDDGETWLNDIGTNSEYSTNGTFGLHTKSAVAVRHRSAVGVFVNDSIQRATVKIPVVALGSYIEAGIIARRRATTDYYSAGVRFGLLGVMTLYINKRVGGVETDIGIATLPVTYTANSLWDMKFYCIGDQLKVMVWSSGAAEPTYAYGLSITDSAINQAGMGGLTDFLNTGNTNTLSINISWDNYSKLNPVHVDNGDSGWITSTVAAYTFPANALVNNQFYEVIVNIQDTGGLYGSSIAAFKTIWTHPALGDTIVTTDDFGATISWTAANMDISFISWRVYRRYQVPSLSDLDDNGTASTWYLIYETVDNVGPYSFKDYLVPLNKQVDYVVVQLADRFGSLIESNPTTPVTTQMASDRYFFVPSVPIGTIASYEAMNVTDDNWTDEVEQQTLHILNRGRQVQVGDDLGATGTLTIQLRGPNARADREFIQRLASSKTINVWMKNPFGDVKYVKFANMSVKFLSGTGQTEMSDMTIPYVEVIRPAQLTRS